MNLRDEFHIPERDAVNPDQQAIFDLAEKEYGFVPNLMATMALSKTALSKYMTLATPDNSLTDLENEVISLVTSGVNDSLYCLSYHTEESVRKGLTRKEILKVRMGRADFDERLNILATTVRRIVIHRGNLPDRHFREFLNQGFTMEQFIDMIVVIGQKNISNLLFKTLAIPVDFKWADSVEQPAY